MMPIYRYLITLCTVAVLTGCQKQSDPRNDIVRKLDSTDQAIVHVIIEGESLTKASGSFATGKAKGANANAALLIPAGAAKRKKVTGAAVIDLDVPAPTKVNCWLRVKWTGTCSNSVIIKAPGVPPKIVGESATYNRWHWVKGPSFQATQGLSKVELKAREDGVFIDQVMLTSDLERVPVGIE